MGKNKLSGVPATALKFYTRNIARAWRLAAANAPPGMLIVLSPYITSNTAESVLSAGIMCAVHTVFEVELFASGASSLKTLRALAANGHALFHIPLLHAKVVLDPNSFVSVGSQNLTQAGTKKKEISVGFSDEETSKSVAALILPWLDERVPITAEMIDEMEACVGPVEALFSVAQAKAHQIQAEFDARQAERAAEEIANLNAEMERTARLAKLQADLSVKPQSLEIASGRVTKIEGCDMDFPTTRHSLMSVGGRDLTSWTIEGHTTTLQPFRRYLCVLSDVGRIGWARVAKTRITFVHDVLDCIHDPININDVLYTMRCHCERATPAPHGRNIWIEMRGTASEPVCVVSAWFSPESLTILDVAPADKRKPVGAEASKLIGWIQSFEGMFKFFAMRVLTRPFTYQSALSGQQADQFFGPPGTMVEMRAALVRDHPMLIARYI